MILKKYFIPHFISLSSIYCGFLGIILASADKIALAGFVIILGGIFDGLDGKVARALKVANKMGQEMDSLADLTTFGISTGFLLYKGSLFRFGNLGIIVAAMIPIFAAIRLARFNVRPTKNHFEGMPSTWAGISIAILQGFYGHLFPFKFFLFFAVLTAFLMISRFKYIKGDLNFLKLKSSKIILAISILVAVFYKFSIGFAIPVFWYSISGILFTIFEKMDIGEVKPYKIKY